MKKVKKVLSSGLCALIAMLAPGIGAYQAAALDVNAGGEVAHSEAVIPLTPASVETQMQNIGEKSAENFLEAPLSAENSLPESPQEMIKAVTPAKTGIQIPDRASSQILARRNDKISDKIGASIQRTAKSFTVKFKQIRAAVSQKVSDSISDKTRELTRLFDGSKLAPAYAKTRASSFNFAARKKFVLGNYLSQEAGPASSGPNQAEPPTERSREEVPLPNSAEKRPAPSSNNDSAALEAAIQSALNQAQTVSFMIKKMGVYQSAQDVVRDLKTDPSGVDSEALGNLSMTAGSVAGQAKNVLIPAVQNIVSVSKSLAGKNVSIDVAKWAQLKEAGQAAAQDLKDMSVVSAQIADALSSNKASSDDIAAWKTLSSAFVDNSTGLAAALQKVFSPAAPSGQKAVLANAQDSSLGKIAFAVSFIALMIAASHLAPLAVVGVILGAGIGAAMTPKGQDSSVNMLVGMFLGLGIGAMLAPATAHAATMALSYSDAAAPHLLNWMGKGALTGGIVGVISAFADFFSDNAQKKVPAPLLAWHTFISGISGSGLGAVLGMIIGAFAAIL